MGKFQHSGLGRIANETPPGNRGTFNFLRTAVTASVRKKLKALKILVF